MALAVWHRHDGLSHWWLYFELPARISYRKQDRDSEVVDQGITRREMADSQEIIEQVPCHYFLVYFPLLAFYTERNWKIFFMYIEKNLQLPAWNDGT
jgi:hypothetical protein